MSSQWFVRMCICAMAVAAVMACSAQKRATTRVSVSSLGEQGNGGSLGGSVSGDGRYVAFESGAKNLVPNDTNLRKDVFVRDQWLGLTKRVSVTTYGLEADDQSGGGTMSQDGRYVVFSSYATNLVLGDNNGFQDVFLHDLHTGQTTLVSLSSTGEQANADCSGYAISQDGRYVAFDTKASNLVPGDTNGHYDAFVRDRLTGQTKRVSVSTSGVQGDEESRYPEISGDGRFVGFDSKATTLVPLDTNAKRDAFLHDMATGVTTRISETASGTQGNGNSYLGGISVDGRYVTMDSYASNFKVGDSNNAMDVFLYDRLTRGIIRVSESDGGWQGNDHSLRSSISADARFVAFDSYATNLVGGDTNSEGDIFVVDVLRHVTTRLSLTDSGEQANGYSLGPRISADGRFVGYYSIATNLVSGDTNGQPDTYVTRRGPIWAPPFP